MEKLGCLPQAYVTSLVVVIVVAVVGVVDGAEMTDLSTIVIFQRFHLWNLKLVIDTNPKKSSNGRKTSVSQLWGLTMSLLHRIGETCFCLMPFVSQKRGFFGPYLVQMATFGISSYFGHFIMLFSDLFWICPLCSWPVWPFNFHHAFSDFFWIFPLCSLMQVSAMAAVLNRHAVPRRIAAV